MKAKENLVAVFKQLTNMPHKVVVLPRFSALTLSLDRPVLVNRVFSAYLGVSEFSRGAPP